MTRFGVPTASDRLLLWFTTGLLCCCTYDWRRVRRFVLEWCPLVVLILAYDFARGRAGHFFTQAHVLPQIWVGRYLGGGTVPVVWLQRHLWHGPFDLQWYDYACWGVYMSFFFVTPVVAAALWLRNPHAFRLYAGMTLTLAFGGVVTFALFPAMPPWLASQNHFLPPVTHIINVVSSHFRFIDSSGLFEGERYANLVAAIPSLHAAYSLLAALMLASLTRRRVRYALFLYPLAMAFTLTYTAEHYTIDILLGWLYAYAAYRLVRRVVESPREDTARDYRRWLPRRG